MWTNDVVLRLIDLFRSYECLWDTANNDYKNKNKKRASWEEIAQKMNMPREVTETKIHNLRSQFTRERKKIHASKKAGIVATEDAKQSNWFAYESLMFLLKGETSSGAMNASIESVSFTFVPQFDHNIIFINSPYPIGIRPSSLLKQANNTDC